MRRAAVALALAFVLACASGPRDLEPDRVLAARAGGALLQPVPGLSIEQAYALQARATQLLLARGERLSGYKVAFTSAQVQRDWGIDVPAFGPLLGSMRVPANGIQPADAFRSMRAEVEIAFEIGTRIAAPLEGARLRAAVSSVRVGLELADIRFAPGARPSAADVIADGAGAHAFALGPPHTPEAVHPGTDCELRIDGNVFGHAPARAALGDPWNVLAWLVAELVRQGQTLEAGQVVLTGALGPVWAPETPEPAQLEGRCAGLGRVAVSLR